MPWCTIHLLTLLNIQSQIHELNATIKYKERVNTRFVNDTFVIWQHGSEALRQFNHVLSGGQRTWNFQ